MDTRRRQDLLHEQAMTVQREFPELYGYLKARDECLMRAINRLPSPADIELYSAPGVRAQVENALRHLDPGIDRLAH
ncbi:MAG: hypothetical protein ACOC9Y_04305 [Chloroflexota bacterium]